MRAWLATVMVAVAAGCGGVAPVVPASTPPEAAQASTLATPPAETPAPTLTAPPTILPTEALTPAPTASPSPTPTPTEAPTPTPPPTPSPAPTRTLAPGETPRPTPIDLSPYLTAGIGIVNLSDQAVTVTVDIYDSGKTLGTVAMLDLAPYDSDVQSIPEGSYGVTFKRAGSGALETCPFSVKGTQRLDFAIVNDRITVIEAGQPPKMPDELFLATSPLCGRNS